MKFLASSPPQTILYCSLIDRVPFDTWLTRDLFSCLPRCLCVVTENNATRKQRACLRFSKETPIISVRFDQRHLVDKDCLWGSRTVRRHSAPYVNDERGVRSQPETCSGKVPSAHIASLAKLNSFETPRQRLNL